MWTLKLSSKLKWQISAFWSHKMFNNTRHAFECHRFQALTLIAVHQFYKSIDCPVNTCPHKTVWMPATLMVNNTHQLVNVTTWFYSSGKT